MERQLNRRFDKRLAALLIPLSCLFLVPVAFAPDVALWQAMFLGLITGLFVLVRYILITRQYESSRRRRLR